MAITDIVMLPAPVGHITEFAGGFSGTCGETALSVALCAAAGIAVSEQYMVDLTHDMINHGWASANGASAIGGLTNEAKLRGFTVTNYGYSEPFNVDWHDTLLKYAGVKPIVLELANGQALKDVETGSGENAVNLHYHYICIVGKQSDGYIVADGDNFQVLSRFQIYSYGVLLAAQVCAMLVVEMQRTASGGPHVTLPAGWTDDGKTLRAPGVSAVVTQGFRDLVLAGNWDAANVPITNAYGDGKGGTLQDFRWTRTGWNSTKGVYIALDTRGVCDSLRGQVKTLSDANDSLNKLLAAANNNNKVLSGQLADAQAKLTQDQSEIQTLESQVADPKSKQARELMDGIVAYINAK